MKQYVFKDLGVEGKQTKAQQQITSSLLIYREMSFVFFSWDFGAAHAKFCMVSAQGPQVPLRYLAEDLLRIKKVCSRALQCSRSILSCPPRYFLFNIRCPQSYRMKKSQAWFTLMRFQMWLGSSAPTRCPNNQWLIPAVSRRYKSSVVRELVPLSTVYKRLCIKKNPQKSLINARPFGLVWILTGMPSKKKNTRPLS